MAVVFVAGMVVTLRTGDATWFFVFMIGGAALFLLLDKTVFAERNRRERAAQKRFFGLEE